MQRFIHCDEQQDDHAAGDLVVDELAEELLVGGGEVVEHQMVQKLHACTTTDRDGNNDRAHDLPTPPLASSDEDLAKLA